MADKTEKTSQVGVLYPCPACGFLIFDEPAGSYDICRICGWEDDHVQLHFPFMRGGANGECLFKWQRRVIDKLPLEIKSCRGFQRDAEWRPLTEEESDFDEIPKTGLDYFNATAEIDLPEYYWRK
jgi:hypothetical protein